VETLKSFSPHFSILFRADLIILDQEKISVHFEWKDLQGQILFPTIPVQGRQHELWKQTCFEAFFRQKGEKSYFEINLSPTGAWNVYHFKTYRSPQPPTEYLEVQMLELIKEKESFSATFQIQGVDLSRIDASLCAILKLKNAETTYWSTHHMSHKPDFHHPDCFTLERKST